MNQRKVSARYYLFEDLLWELPGFSGLKRSVSIADLQAYAAFIWARERGRGEPPIIRARRCRSDTSFCIHDKPATIHLIAKHQNLGGMLHELAHALGTRDKLSHGPAFRSRCIRLYRDYGGWDGQVNWEKP